jgi:tRNA(Ile)-lysidine synthetase-like protein
LLDLTKITEIFRHNLINECKVQKKEKGIIAVSGGGDSTLLLRLFSILRDDLDLDLEVVTLNHGLRPTAAREVAWVEALASNLGFAFNTAMLDVPSRAAAEKTCVEEAGRLERRAALEQIAERRRARWIALGHTLTDQAETLLMRLRRGTGLDGLAAMRPRHGAFIRPLLWIERDVARATLREHGWCWLDDESNEDIALERARLRQELIPFVAQDRLAEIAEAAHRAARGVSELERPLQERWVATMTSCVHIDREPVSELPEALAIRALRRAMRPLWSHRLPLERREARSLFELMRLERGRQLDIRGARALVSGPGARRLIIARSIRAPQNCSVTLERPGRYRLDRLAVTIAFGDARPRSPIWGRVTSSTPIEVRGRLPGDRLVLSNDKLKRLWEDTGVWSWLRDWVPLVAREGHVIWTAVNPNRSLTGPILSFELDENNPLRQWLRFRNREAMVRIR